MFGLFTYHNVAATSDSIFSLFVQGWTLWCALGSVNMRRENCAFLPAAGRRTQLFHVIFTEPGAHHKVHPCTHVVVGHGVPDRAALCGDELVAALVDDADAHLALVTLLPEAPAKNRRNL